jgi:chromosome segregation ATPase
MSYYGNNEDSDRYIQTITNLSKKIHEQKEQIEDLEKKFKGLHTVVNQLVGGLYNHEKQRESIDVHLSFLFSKDEEDEEDEEDEDKEKVKNTSEGWGIYPTTRQGDALEEKVRILEAQISSLEKATSKSDNISDSNCFSVRKKRRNSSYLCGNE